MKILVTNDDGINSVGLKVLTEKLLKYASKIIVVAPKYEMSATSQKLSLKDGLTIEKTTPLVDNVDTYIVSGTPSDCVRVAIDFLKYDPDIVFSGVNNGYNLGSDILYSGTIAACFEANLNNIKGFAISCERKSLDGMKYFDEVIKMLLKHDIYKDAKILNINLPATSNGIRFTHQGVLPYDCYYVLESDNLYHLKGTPLINDLRNDINSDVYAVYNNYISVTPLTVDRTHKEVLEKYLK